MLPPSRIFNERVEEHDRVDVLHLPGSLGAGVIPRPLTTTAVNQLARNKPMI
jgi:hypothetical protein